MEKPHYKIHKMGKETEEQQQDQSNCQDCQRNRIKQSEDRSSSFEEDSSSSDNSISLHFNSRVPLRTQNSPLNFIQEEMKLLRIQNANLQAQNRELKHRTRNQINQNLLKSQLLERQKQIRQLKMQLIASTCGVNNNNRISQPLNQISKKSLNNISKKHLMGSKQTRQYLRTGKKDQKCSETDRDELESVRFHLFENKKYVQQFKSQKKMLYSQITSLQEKIIDYERQLKWMANLTEKIINMSIKLSYVFKQKVIESKWSVLKQAKVSWRYLKHILNYLIAFQ